MKVRKNNEDRSAINGSVGIRDIVQNDFTIQSEF